MGDNQLQETCFSLVTCTSLEFGHDHCSSVAHFYREGSISPFLGDEGVLCNCSFKFLKYFNNPFSIRHLSRLGVEMSKDGTGKKGLGKAKFLFHSMMFSLEDNQRAIEGGKHCWRKGGIPQHYKDSSLAAV